MSENRGQMEGMRDLSEINRVVHEPSRLMILMYLYSVEKADFVFLVNATELTWGNLSSHVSKLEEVGYVDVEKGYVGKKPRTLVQLTSAGRRAIDSYRRTMRVALKNLEE